MCVIQNKVRGTIVGSHKSISSSPNNFNRWILMKIVSHNLTTTNRCKDRHSKFWGLALGWKHLQEIWCFSFLFR
jgi:hypothetical protein